MTSNRTAPGAVLAGSLSAFPLLDVLELLSRTKHTGDLQVVGESVDEHLWVDDGTLIENDTRSTTRLFELARLHDAWFTVTSSAPPKSSTGNRVALEPLIDEVAPQLHEWDVLFRAIPMEALVKMASSTPGPEVQIRAEQWHLLAVVGTGRTVREVIDATGGTPLESLRLMQQLLDERLIALELASERPAAPAPVAEPAPEPEPKPAPRLAIVPDPPAVVDPTPTPPPAPTSAPRRAPQRAVASERSSAPERAAARAPERAPAAERAPEQAPAAERTQAAERSRAPERAQAAERRPAPERAPAVEVTVVERTTDGWRDGGDLLERLPDVPAAASVAAAATEAPFSTVTIEAPVPPPPAPFTAPSHPYTDTGPMTPEPTTTTAERVVAALSSEAALASLAPAPYMPPPVKPWAPDAVVGRRASDQSI